MTINVKEAATVQDPITTPVDKRCKPVYCIDNGKRWNSAVECAEELGVHHRTVRSVCNGKLNSCKRLRFRYEENVAEVRTMMATEIGSKDAEIAKLNAIIAAMQPDAEVGRKIREEQEAARKAEEDRLKAIEDTKTALAKANERKERRQRIVEQKDADLQRSVSRLTDSEREVEELTIKLLELEGITKER